MLDYYKNRSEAGIALSGALIKYKGRSDVVILALPRGGVPVAYEVARDLDLPLDVWIVRKLGVPGHEEYAMGAIAMSDHVHINRDIARGLHISDHLINQVIARERRELARRNKTYRQGRAAINLKGKTVILVDDGLATGATMKIAVQSLWHGYPEKIIVAVPVGSADAVAMLEDVADDVICLKMPEPFYGVGRWYEKFPQTSDVEVLELLGR